MKIGKELCVKTTTIALLVILATPRCFTEELSLNCALSKGWSVSGSDCGSEVAISPANELTPVGEHCLSLRYHFKGENPKLSYCQYQLDKRHSFSLRVPQKMILWIKGDGKQHPIAIRFVDENNRTHQWKIVYCCDWKGWRKIKFDLFFGKRGYNAWGGKSVKKIFSIRFFSFVIDKRLPGDDDRGTLLIGGIRLLNK